MPTSRSAKKRMEDEIRKAIAEGDSFRANEITANVMVGTTMLVVFVLLLGCLILNEINVFTVDKSVMRWAVFAALAVELPITIVNTVYVGTKSWLRRVLMGDLVVVCAILAAILGHNVTLIMVLPVIISTRYFDRGYTTRIAAFTAILFLIASIINGFYGVKNINIYYFTSDAKLTAEAGQKLRNIISSVPYDRVRQIKTVFIEDFLPRCIVFFAISVICRYIAQRGKDMIKIEAEKTKKASRIETELDLATIIQTSMLPCLLPAFPGHENIDLRAVYHPAKEVGGDFYDYFIIDKTHVGVVIADVSGKGVGAALFMTISKTVLKNQLQLGISPAEALTNSNRQLCENNEAGLFVTCWAGVIDTETGMLTFVNAGHNPPVLLRKGEAPQLLKQRPGFVLAGLEGYQYQQEELQLSVSDEMFFYTDGVTEATDAKNQLYGEQRLLNCLADCRDKSVEAQLTVLKEDIDRFVGGIDQFDDITIMAMRIT